MSVELVKNPKAIHTMEDDIESVFWVLLWLYLLYMKTDVEPGMRSSILNGIMNPNVYNGTGGVAKAGFIEGISGISSVKTKDSSMSDLLTQLHAVVQERYRPADKDATTDIQGGVLTLIEEYALEVVWSNDDRVAREEVLTSYNRSSTLRSSSKRSLAELNGAIETLPPAKRLVGTT